MNGEYYINCTVISNRKTQEVIDILKMFHYIGKIATGSYGIFYLRDDEDINGKENKFQVFILSRGTIREEEETFLSPFIPIVEDIEE